MGKSLCYQKQEGKKKIESHYNLHYVPYVYLHFRELNIVVKVQKCAIQNIFFLCEIW